MFADFAATTAQCLSAPRLSWWWQSWRKEQKKYRKILCLILLDSFVNITRISWARFLATNREWPVKWGVHSESFRGSSWGITVGMGVTKVPCLFGLYPAGGELGWLDASWQGRLQARCRRFVWTSQVLGSESFQLLLAKSGSVDLGRNFQKGPGGPFVPWRSLKILLDLRKLEAARRYLSPVMFFLGPGSCSALKQHQWCAIAYFSHRMIEDDLNHAMAKNA